MAAPLCAALLMLAALVAVGCGGSKPESEGPEGWDLPASARPGAQVFRASGCTNCHTYRGSGSRNVGGSDLTTVGRRHGRRFFERFVAHPEAFGNDVMPPFSALGRQRLRQLAIFLAASKELE